MVTPLFVTIHTILVFWYYYLFTLLGDMLIMPRFRPARQRYAWFLPFVAVAVLTEYVCSPYVKGFVRIIICLFFVLWMYRDKVLKKVMVLTLYYVMMILGEVLTSALVDFLGIAEYFDMNSFSLVVGLIVCLLFPLVRGIERLINIQLSWRTWLKIGYCAICTIALTNQFWYMYYRYVGMGSINHILSADWRDILSVILIVLQFGVIYMLFSIVHEMSQGAEALNRSRMDEMKTRHALEQSQMMLENAETVHRMQHDMKNHLLAIEALSDDAERRRAYIRQLTSELTAKETPSQCGNRLIDSLIAYKAAIMERARIELSLQLSPLPDQVNLDGAKLCAMIANVLDNAIEACDRLPQDRARWIELTIRRDVESLFLRVANSCADAGQAVQNAMKEKGRWFDKAGTGMESIRRAIGMLNGEMSLRAGGADDEVALSIYIPEAIPRAAQSMTAR